MGKVLRLHSWERQQGQGEDVAPADASLSPSFRRLLLLSHSGTAKVIKLCSQSQSRVSILEGTVVSSCWGCHSDCYSVGGPFEELLFTCGNRGLVIYGFAANREADISLSTIELPANVGQDLKLTFPEAVAWPELVGFAIPYDSLSSSRLLDFAAGSEQRFITKLISGSSNLVAMLLSQPSQASDQTILIATISEWEVRWSARVLLSREKKWIDLALVLDRLFGLTRDGEIFLWDAVSGEKLSVLSVPCRNCSRILPAQGISLVGVIDKLGQVFLLSLNCPYYTSSIRADSDIWLSHQHETRHRGPSAFSSQMLPAATVESKRLRTVVLPPVTPGDVVAAAINSCTLTRLVVTDGQISLSQNSIYSLATVEEDANASCDITEVFGFSFQGSVYLVASGYLAVVLPPLPEEKKCGPEPWWSTGSALVRSFSSFSLFNCPQQQLEQWKMAVLDRCLIYDGLEEAEHLSVENGWDLKLTWLRKLQLALDFRRTEEVGLLLNKLAPVGAAQEGVLRVIFTSVELMLDKFGSDNELAQAARFLALAAHFTRELIRCYGSRKGTGEGHMSELAQLLETIRTLEEHARTKRPKTAKGDVGTEISEKLEKKNQVIQAEEEALNSDAWLVPSGLSSPEDRRHPTQETSREMIARWEKENMDIVGIVKDALRAGRLPLAVMQLHHRNSREVETDVFKEIQDVGRSIVYELFCKDKMPLALAALRRLGEDIQSVLHDLAFGTVRRSLRAHMTRELRRHGHLGAKDYHLIQTVTRIESLYPRSRFWNSYNIRQRNDFAEDQHLRVCCFTPSKEFVVDCGEVDGVVLGSWSAVISKSTAEDEAPKEDSSEGYWAGALVWIQVLDLQTIDRMFVEQFQASDVPWGSRLKFAMVHHSWPGVSILINDIPSLELQKSELQVDFSTFVNVNHLTSDLRACTSWLWHSIEQDLIRRHVFLRLDWRDRVELLCLLGQGHLMFLTSEEPEQSGSAVKELEMGLGRMIQQLVVQHCVCFNLSWFLELYLDESFLEHDDLAPSLGDSPWACWLLWSRQRGRDYDAAFANARTVLSSEALSTLDDVAELGSAVMALAILVHAPVLPQKCIYSGVVKCCSRSWQCALELLKPRSTGFSTLWNSLVSGAKPTVDYGQLDLQFLIISADGLYVESALPTYLQWRRRLFSTAHGETSLLLIPPIWLPKVVRRVLQLSAQEANDTDFVSPLVLEDFIRKQIATEIRSKSSETPKNKIERLLLQGRAVAAFQAIVTSRADSGKAGDFSSLNKVEQELLGVVMPLAVRNFKSTLVTAACALLLELCGVCATALRTDISALRRVFDGEDGKETSKHLVEMLSEQYNLPAQAVSPSVCVLLKFLEKATLENISSQKAACGPWLKNGQGNGQQLRTLQMSMSAHWSLVTTFCRVHHLPLSTLYLSYLASNNDWVGFLAEAQAEACPLDVLIAVATEYFTDKQVQSHVLNVLNSLSFTNQAAASEKNTTSDLFALLTEAEHHASPGTDLLDKARSLRWPLLTVVASCFSDVSSISCLAAWLEITAERETSDIRISEGAGQVVASVAAAVDAANASPCAASTLPFYARISNNKRRRLMSTEDGNEFKFSSSSSLATSHPLDKQQSSDGSHEALAKMVAILCEQQRFIPLLRAFELFLPASPLLNFVRFLRAFSQMRLSEASAHLADFSSLLKEEIHIRGARTGTTWITKAALAGADAMLAACPSAYEKRCMLQLLAAADFGDGGAAAMGYRRLYWKIQLAEPMLRKGRYPVVEASDLEDDALLKELESSGQWEDARSWARHLDLNEQGNSHAVHHVTEMQAEAMVTEWKELLWDVQEQRTALWRHCQALFTKHSYPPLKAGMFFLKHAEDVEQHGSPAELHAVLLLALQWLSGSITGSAPVYPIHLLRELETRVWLLAVESEVLLKTSGSSFRTGTLNLEAPFSISGSPVDRTAAKIAAVDGHLRVFNSMHIDVDNGSARSRDGGPKPKRRLLRRKEPNVVDVPPERKEESATGWEDKVGEREVERAILSLVEVGQVSAARQLQQKLSPNCVPLELNLVEAALSVANLSCPTVKGSIRGSVLGAPVMKTLSTLNLLDVSSASPLQVMEALTAACREGCGRGHCRRITAVAQVANFLDLPFFEAFQKQPTELLQLLSLKGQDALSEAKLLVSTHLMNPASIARILAESFLKGLLAAHRGGYMDSSSSLREEGPAPLLWRSSDFIQWGQLCPSEQELGHALMRLVISGHDMPHSCEVELLILAHQFYESSACLDGMDVLVALAATRVESYVAEGDFPALARMVTGVSNFQALRFVLDLLIENGQLELLLKKRAAVDATKESSASVRGFRMAVLSALKHFNPHDLDAFGMVYSHFSMAHEMANLLESRGCKGLDHWFIRNDPDQNEELLDIMRFFVEASEVYAGIDCGNKTRWCCAQASLLSLQLRMPEWIWLNLTETNARRLLVDQRRFQEALIIAEAYGLNQPAEWVPVLWNQVLSPGWIEHFLREFVASLPLRPSTLMELARIYRSEVSARGDHLDFSKWLTSGMPPEITKSFRCILKHVGDFRLRTQLTTLASGFPDVLDACARILDKVPDTAGPLVLKRGHGGTYVPVM